MPCRRTLVASCVALCLTFTGGLNPAFAGGLISTERVVEQAAQPVATVPVEAHSAAAQRVALLSALVSAGVDREHAQARLEVLTDAEIAQLTKNIDSAPAGGLWFLPFMLVAAVIGVLIGTRDSSGSGKITTDLFGNPRTATSP